MFSQTPFATLNGEMIDIALPMMRHNPFTAAFGKATPPNVPLAITAEQQMLEWMKNDSVKVRNSVRFP